MMNERYSAGLAMPWDEVLLALEAGQSVEGDGMAGLARLLGGG